MQILKEIEAKLVLLKHLQREKVVDRDVADAAKMWLGKDLCDALAGEIPIQLLRELKAKRARLEKKDFQLGDEVWFMFGSERTTSKILEVNGNSVQLDFRKGFNENREGCTSTELDALTDLMISCTRAQQDR